MLVVHFKDGRETQFEKELLVIENELLIVGKENFQLEKVSGFMHGGKEYFVYTGQEYIEQVEADYEAFGEEANVVPFEELNTDSIWGRAKRYKNDTFVVCDGMLEITSSKEIIKNYLKHKV